MDTAIASFVPGRSSGEIIRHRLLDYVAAGQHIIAHRRYFISKELHMPSLFTCVNRNGLVIILAHRGTAYRKIGSFFYSFVDSGNDKDQGNMHRRPES